MNKGYSVVPEFDGRVIDPRGEMQSIAVRYVSLTARPAVATLFALDDRLAAIVRTTTEPLIGQMRLGWWREAVTALDAQEPPAEPLLQAVQREVLARGVAGRDLADLVDGWEVLLVADGLDQEAVGRHGVARGARLFRLAAQLLGGDAATLDAAGEGWAMADLAAHCSRPAEASLARDLAEERLDQALAARWPRPLRPLGVMTLLARIDLEPEEARSRALARFARVLRMSLTGR